MKNVLDEIAEFHRSQWANDERSLAEIEAGLVSLAPTRDFAAALRADRLSVIAEIKRRSPSAGEISEALEPSTLAQQYEGGGASCLSVLTDQRYFGGSVRDLQQARAAVEIPVLRKDFTVDERDVLEARAMGADAILLIAAVLDDAELTRFRRLAKELDLAALVEVHDEIEMQRAIASGAGIIGVNQRNLGDFSIDCELALRLHPSIPPGVVSVAESGIRDASDAEPLARAGYDAVLVGTSLVSSGDPAGSIKEMKRF